MKTGIHPDYVEATEHPLDLAPPQARRFAELVGGLPGMECVAYAQDGDLLVLWSLTGEYDPGTNDTIYSSESALREEWPNVRFDFHVRPLVGRTAEAVLPSRFRVIWSHT